MSNILIYLGVDEDGNIFRPSNWACRICGTTAYCDDRKRIQYSSHLTPVVIDGIKGIKINKSLEQENPLLYNQVIDFVKSNRLKEIVL